MTGAAARAVAPRLELADLGASTCEAVIDLARSTWDRPTSQDYLRWRYSDATTQEAMVALAGSECVATMFALRRAYHTPGGIRPCLEPFDWHAVERWRAMGAGLRVVKRLMAGPDPLVGLGGSPLAASLIARLGWTEVAKVGTYVLPLRGAFFRARGRRALTARLFDLLGRWHFAPSARSEPRIRLRPCDTLGPQALEIARRQQRFAWMRVPDNPTLRWLASAPPEMGRFRTHEVLVEEDVVGWVSARVHRSGGVTHGDLQEVFLRDDARDWYEAVIRAECVALAAEGVDVVKCVTSCPDTVAALRALRFRLDHSESAFVWMGGEQVPRGPALFNGAHADRAFFPLPTAAEAAELSQNGC